MPKALKKSTGREVWAMLLDDSEIKSGASVTLTKGHLYCVVVKGTGSNLPDVGVGYCFFAMTAIALVADDEVTVY